MSANIHLPSTTLCWAIMHMREPHWGVLHLPSSVLHIYHHVHQEPHLGVLHLTSSVLHVLSCTSGASLGCTTFAIKCTACAIMHIRSLSWVYCIAICMHAPYFKIIFLTLQLLSTSLLAIRNTDSTH